METLWTVPLSGAATPQAATDDRHAYLRLDEGTLAAFELRTGERRWAVKAGSAQPSAAGDQLVFAADETAVQAFDAASGAPAWSTPIAAPLAAPMQWESGWLVAGTQTGTLLAIRAADGTVVWQREVGQLRARPTIAGELLVLPMDEGVAALRLRTGESVWQQRFGGRAHEVLAAGARLYSGSNDNFFYCLDAASGRVEWRFRTGADVIGRPAADDERVYFVSLDNVLRGLDRGNGAQRWKRALPLRPTAGPTLVGDQLLVSGLGRVVLSYNTRTGEAAGEFTAGGDLILRPLPVDGTARPTVVLATRDIAKGDQLQAIVRVVEPPLRPIAPFPNPILLERPEAADESKSNLPAQDPNAKPPAAPPRERP